MLSNAGLSVSGLVCTIGQLLTQFARLYECRDSWSAILGKEAFHDDGDEVDSRTKGRQALDELARRHGQSPLLSVNHFASMVEKTVGRTVETMGKTMARVKRAGQDSVVLLSEDDLDVILPQIFLPQSDGSAWDVEQRAGTFERWDTEHALPEAKSAPAGSLVWSFALYAARVFGHCGRLQSLAVLWNEFVLEVRWHWENASLLPRSGQTTDFIDTSCCLLHQKLQMINVCIRRKVARDAHRKQVCATTPAQAAAKGSDDEWHSAEDESGDGGADEDDEFFLAPEDEEGMMQRLQSLKTSIAQGSLQHSNSPQSAPSVDVSRFPSGVKSVHPDLHLLHSDKPLHIPLTQEEGSGYLE